MPGPDDPRSGGAAGILAGPDAPGAGTAGRAGMREGTLYRRDRRAGAGCPVRGGGAGAEMCIRDRMNTERQALRDHARGITPPDKLTKTQKKIAMGHKPDDHEETPQQNMGGMTMGW